MAPDEPSLGHGATHSARLLISCPDGPGIVAAVGGFLYESGANIVTSDQYSTHPERGSFFMRVAFFLPGLAQDRESFKAAFGELAQRFEMNWRMTYAAEPKRAVLMASREDHCLTDLLWRHRRGELDMDLLGGDLQPRRPAPRRRDAGDPLSPRARDPGHQAAGGGRDRAS